MPTEHPTLKGFAPPRHRFVHQFRRLTSFKKPKCRSGSVVGRPGAVRQFTCPMSRFYVQVHWIYKHRPGRLARQLVSGIAECQSPLNSNGYVSAFPVELHSQSVATALASVPTAKIRKFGNKLSPAPPGGHVATSRSTRHANCSFFMT
jgi:hypothetical protein